MLIFLILILLLVVTIIKNEKKNIILHSIFLDITNKYSELNSQLSDQQDSLSHYLNTSRKLPVAEGKNPIADEHLPHF